MAQKAEIRSEFPERVRRVLQDFWGMSVLFLFFIFLFRVVEIALIFSNHVLDFGIKEILLFSFLQDLSWGIYFLGMLFIISIPTSLISLRISRTISLMTLSTALIVHVGVIFYFIETLIPLGQDLFAYNWNDIFQTVSASGQLTFLNLVLGLFFMLGIVTSLIWSTKWLNFDLNTFLLITPIFIFSIFLVQFFPKYGHDSGSEIKQNIQLNKSQYLVEQSFEKWMYGGEFYFDFFLRSTNKNMMVKKDFFDEEYPFMHNADYPDVLSPFFDTLLSPPNLVFILAESFGKAYSGKNAYLGSFTPFLDSLENHSLVWENNLSTTGRTFGVLPGILGGFPFGEKGFLELFEEYPYHQSLISILKNNGYQSRFFIGSDRKFDHQGDFLEYQKLDVIEDEFTFLPGYQKTPSKTGFSWGYPDKELFMNALRKIPESSNSPEILIFQTITSHSPYIVPENEEYNQKFEKHISNVLKISPEKKEDYNSYKNIYKTILYADDAIRLFFEKFKDRPEFENTIFIITGDHRLPEIPMSSRLDRFHVPLLIYSPKLKVAKKFKGMSSHFEITPSLLAFLKSNFKISYSDDVVWLGQVLDTARTFQSRLVMPLMRNKNQLVEFISGEYFLSDGQVFQISEGLNIDLINEPDLRTQLIGEFEDFKNKNNYMLQTRKLLKPNIKSLASH